MNRNSGTWFALIVTVVCAAFVLVVVIYTGTVINAYREQVSDMVETCNRVQQDINSARLEGYTEGWQECKEKYLELHGMEAGFEW